MEEGRRHCEYGIAYILMSPNKICYEVNSLLSLIRLEDFYDVKMKLALIGGTGIPRRACCLLVRVPYAAVPYRTGIQRGVQSDRYQVALQYLTS